MSEPTRPREHRTPRASRRRGRCRAYRDALLAVLAEYHGQRPDSPFWSDCAAEMARIAREALAGNK